MREELLALAPDGPASRLGDGVEAVLKSFRGGSLAAIVMFTDGVTTAGDDLPQAGREAARAGVPLFLVGVGDAREPARPGPLRPPGRGGGRGQRRDGRSRPASRPAGRTRRRPVPVVLSERQADKLVERGRVTVAPDPAGNPVPFELRFTPREAGERTFVIEVAGQPGEADLANNRLERAVLVTESKRVRVLYVEGYPRYEFRFVEGAAGTGDRRPAGQQGRGSEDGAARRLARVGRDGPLGAAGSSRPATSCSSSTWSSSATWTRGSCPGRRGRCRTWRTSSRSAAAACWWWPASTRGRRRMPTRRSRTFSRSRPFKPPPRPTADAEPITEGYRLKPTAAGMTHPLFRFAPDECESRRIAGRLQPLYWFATGYKRKLSAEVLAVHPDRPAEGGPAGENHPLVLQQFVGAGRVLFLGFDETWRWRFRADEEHSTGSGSRRCGCCRGRGSGGSRCGPTSRRPTGGASGWR